MQVLSLSQQLQIAYPPKVQEILGRYAAKSDIPAIVKLLHTSTKERSFANSVRPLLEKAGIKGSNLNRVKNQLWEIAPQNKNFQKKFDRDPGILLAAPRIDFAGTDFTLSIGRGRRPKDTLNYFNGLKELNKFDKAIIPKALAESNEEKKQVQYSFSTILIDSFKENSNIINPDSTDFEIAAWYFFVYLEASHQLTEAAKVEDGIQYVKLGAVKQYFATLADSLGEEWVKVDQYFADLVGNDSDYIEFEQIQNDLGVEQNLALQGKGIFIAPGTDGYPYEGKIIKELSKERMTSNGIKIPVNYTYGLNPGQLGAGYCDHNRIFISIDALIQADSIVNLSQTWFDDFEKSGKNKPKFAKVPMLLGHWLSAMSFGATGSLTHDESRSLFEEHVLAEELAHAETSAYAEIKLKREAGENYGAAADRHLPYLAYSMMRPDSYIFQSFDEQLKDQDCHIRKEVSKAVWEIQANLQSIITGPLPLLNLQEYLGGVAIALGMDSPDREAYDTAKITIAKLLTEELIPGGKELTDRVDWRGLVEQRKVDSNGELKPIRDAWCQFFDDNFGTIQLARDPANLQKIRDAANAVLVREFYTDSEREVLVPGWKEEHNQAVTKT